MNHYVPVILIVVSLALLGLGAYAWRLTNSRAIMVNGVFSSFSLLYAAFEAQVRHRPEWSFVLPFFATMLLGGRAFGLWWRSRREKALQLPAQLLWTGSALSLGAAVSAYIAL
jgi:hypothetical protein